MCLLAGVLLWLMTLALAVGFATFAFLALPSLTHLGISMQLLGTAVVFLWLGARSRNPASCVQASPIPAIYISIFIKSCVTWGLTGPAKVSTVLSFVWLTTFIQGISFVVCTRYHMGSVLQYFPVSVTTGYNGGIGLLILNASISMMAGVNPLEDLDSFLQPAPLLLALPGTLLAMVVFPMSLRCSGPASKVLPILSAIAVFYLVLFVTGTTLDEARRLGWVFPYYGFSSPTEALATFDYAEVDWQLLGARAGLVPPMTLIAMIAQYASLGAILLQVAETTKDADEETRHLGVATTLSAFLGSMPNLSGMAPSALLIGVVGNKGARGASLVVCGLLHLAVFLSGFPLVSYLPKCSIAGCLLMPIAFKMVLGALFESLAFSTWGDYIVIWVMSWTTLLMNIQWGLGSGFVLSVFRLLYEYAHFNVVDRKESLGEVVTLKGRDANQTKVLEDHGNEVLAFRLKGVLFFGNGVSLKLELDALLDRGAGPSAGQVRRLPEPPPKFVVVDFSEVAYIDSSVWGILANITQRAQKLSATELFLCGLASDLFGDLVRQGEKLLSQLHLEYINHSYLLTLEQIEDRILAVAAVPQPWPDGWAQFTAWIALGMQPAGGEGQAHAVTLCEQLKQYFVEQDYSEGDIVQRQGSSAAAFYWVMSGEFHVFVQVPTHSGGSGKANQPLCSPVMSRAISKRIVPEDVRGLACLYGKLTQGFIAGGEAFCCDERSQAPNLPMAAHTSMQCKHAGRVLRLGREDFLRFRAENPQLCIAFLLAVAQRREMQLHLHMRYRVEPEVIEVMGGCRRRFTMMTPSDHIRNLGMQFRYAPMRSLLGMAQKGLTGLRGLAIRMQDERASGSASQQLLAKNAALVSHPH